MYEISMDEMTPEFLECWRAAGTHLNNQVQGGINTWLRAHPFPPFLEHLSFRLGNQLFFVRVEDASGKVLGPGTVKGLMSIADCNGGHACFLPMKKKLLGGAWVSELPGWGLADARTRKVVDPISLVTDEKIEMTSWELQDMAVQVVHDYLQKQCRQMMSWQSNPEVDPAIWFIGDSGGPEWVVVRVTKYPENSAVRPANWESIARNCERLSNVGHFASVALVSTEQPFAAVGEKTVPLYRGHGMHVRFTGLE